MHAVPASRVLFDFPGSCLVALDPSMGGPKVIRRVKALRVEVVQWAQYPSALRVTFTPKGCRKRRGTMVDSLPFFVAMEADASVDDYVALPLYGPAVPSANGEYSTATGRHSMFSDAWEGEFRRRVENATTEGRCRVLFDASGWNACEAQQ